MKDMPLTSEDFLKLLDQSRLVSYVSGMRSAMQAWEDGNLAELRSLLIQHLPAEDEQDLRGFEWFYLWQRLENVNKITTLPHDNAVIDVAFSPDGKTLAAASGNIVQLWDVLDQKREKTLKGHNAPVISVAFSPYDNGLLASLGGDEITVWNTNDWSIDRRLSGPVATLPSTRLGRSFGCVRFCPNGKYLAACGRSRQDQVEPAQRAFLWNVDTWQEEPIAKQERNVWSFAFSPDGQSIATASYGGTVTILRIGQGQEPTSFQNHRGHRYDVTFAEGGSTLIAVGNDTRIDFWDIATKKSVATLTGSLGPITSAVVSSDGTTLATGGLDKTIKLWDIETKLIKTTFRGHETDIHAIAFSPDGKMVGLGE